MKVLGHRVLIRPDAQPSQTDSGIILTEDREFVATSGTVVQVGAGGSEMAYKVRQRAIRAVIDGVENLGDDDISMTVMPLLFGMLHTADPSPELRAGDRVAFDADSGHRITVGGEQFLILNYDDALHIVEEAEEAA